jgi:hypothetical protein
MIEPGKYKACLDSADPSNYKYTLEITDINCVKMKSKLNRFNLRFIGRIQTNTTLWYQQEVQLVGIFEVLCCCPPIHVLVLNVYLFKSQRNSNWYMKIIEDGEQFDATADDQGTVYALVRI